MNPNDTMQVIEYKKTTFFKSSLDWKSRPEVFHKEVVPEDFTKFSGKQLLRSTIFSKVVGQTYNLT